MESLEREMKNAKDCKHRANNMVRDLLESLREKNLINKELKEKQRKFDKLKCTTLSHLVKTA